MDHYSFLCGRHQRVVVKGEMSKWFSVVNGVPQGAVLRPLLFILYVNDIPDLVNSKINMFADDIKIYTQRRSFSDALSFQNDLDKLCGWSRDWLLCFNIAKCKNFKYGPNASSSEYYMKDEGSNSKLNVVSLEKDLGVWITSRSDFTLQCDKASAKAMQSLGLIKRSFTHLTKESFQILYKTYIHPYLEYYVSIWNPYLARNIDKLERIQQRATKLVPGLSHYHTKQDYNNLTCTPCIAGDKEEI